MAFSYQTQSGQQAQGINYGQGLTYAPMNDQNRQAISQSIQQQPQQQSGGGLDLMQLLKMYQQTGGDQGGGLAGLAGMLGFGGSSPTPSDNGASYGLGGSLVGGTGEVGGSTFAPSTGSSFPSTISDAKSAGGMWGSLANIIMGAK